MTTCGQISGEQDVANSVIVISLIDMPPSRLTQIHSKESSGLTVTLDKMLTYHNSNKVCSSLIYVGKKQRDSLTLRIFITRTLCRKDEDEDRVKGQRVYILSFKCGQISVVSQIC